MVLPGVILKQFVWMYHMWDDEMIGTFYCILWGVILKQLLGKGMMIGLVCPCIVWGGRERKYKGLQLRRRCVASKIHHLQ